MFQSGRGLMDTFVQQFVAVQTHTHQREAQHADQEQGAGQAPDMAPGGPAGRGARTVGDTALGDPDNDGGQKK